MIKKILLVLVAFLAVVALQPADLSVTRSTTVAAALAAVFPHVKTFYSPSFGMVTDRFGVMWMVIVLAEQCA